MRLILQKTIGENPNGQTHRSVYRVGMTNEENFSLPCSEDDRQRIISEAVFREGFILWLAAHLRKPRCPDLIRLEAAQALEQLVSR